MERRGRPRKHTHKYRCPECGSNWCVKNGKSRNRKQRYLCKECGRNLTIGAERLKKTESLKEQALKIIAEASSISAVSSTLNISPWTIFTWIQREGKRLLKEHEKKQELLQKSLKKEVEEITMDEMWSYVGARKR